MIMPDPTDNSRTPEVPTAFGWYLDRLGQPWRLNPGGWFSAAGMGWSEPSPAAWMPLVRLVEMTNDDDVNALDEARLWARHGYELGQRFAYWSDHGVAPAWLTGGNA